MTDEKDTTPTTIQQDWSAGQYDQQAQRVADRIAAAEPDADDEDDLSEGPATNATLPFAPSEGFLALVAETHPETAQLLRDRSPQDDPEALASFINEALAYTRDSGMPVAIQYAGPGTVFAECDQRIVSLQVTDADWRFVARFDPKSEGDYELVDLGVFDTFAEAAEAHLPPITQRMLRITLDVVVYAAPELAGEQFEEEDADGDGGTDIGDTYAEFDGDELREALPEDIAAIFEDSDDYADGKYGDNPLDEQLAGSGMLLRFGSVRVHDAQWMGEGNIPAAYLD